MILALGPGAPLDQYRGRRAARNAPTPVPRPLDLVIEREPAYHPQRRVRESSPDACRRAAPRPTARSARAARLMTSSNKNAICSPEKLAGSGYEKGRSTLRKVSAPPSDIRMGRARPRVDRSGFSCGLSSASSPAPPSWPSHFSAQRPRHAARRRPARSPSAFMKPSFGHRAGSAEQEALHLRHAGGAPTARTALFRLHALPRSSRYRDHARSVTTEDTIAAQSARPARGLA